MDKLNPTEYYRAERAPYYIVAPDYKEGSSGIRVLHYLCHILNLHGYEAYVQAGAVAEDLWVPQLDDKIMLRHYLARRKPVVIYPEVVAGTPVGLGVKIRYLLNKPGFIAGHKAFDPDEIMVAYREQFIADSGAEHILFLPASDTTLFNPEGTNPERRHGRYFFYYRLLSRGGHLQPLTEGMTEISPAKHRSLDKLAVIFKEAELLYCYEDSAIALEARLCGCPVVYIPNDAMLKEHPEDSYGQNGTAWGASEAEIARAKATVHQVYPAYMRLYEDFQEQFPKFIAMTQEAARQASFESVFPLATVNRKGWPLLGDKEKYRQGNTPSASADQEYAVRLKQMSLLTKSQLDRVHQAWLDQGVFLETDTTFLENSLTERDNPTAKQSFHFFIRLPEGFGSKLADTLDSLGVQIHENWHLDVVSTLPSPDGLEDVPNIGWHTLSAPEEFKPTIDFLAKASLSNWLIEIPPGARLDFLYLWRLANEIAAHPDAVAFFVDDDSCDDTGKRHSPRFKPGCNPAALLSADLAGPICMRHDAWIEAGEASQRAGSPWFIQLLRIVDRFGWQTIKHIPDILISYPDYFPSDTESCMLALVENQQAKGIDSEIVPATGQSWCIRYPLKQAPSISIVILSTGQLDLLSRCVTSIIGKTDYQNFEIIIALTNLHGAPDLDSWLANVEQAEQPKIRVVRTEYDGNYAMRCNAGANASCNDFLLFLKEEAVVIQEKWLDELVRSGAQPGIGGISPRMIQPGNAMIENAGSVLGLNGIVGSPYQGKTKLGEELGYLDCIHVARDVSTLPAACMLIRKESYIESGGMDESDLGNHLAEVDLSMRIRRNGERLIYQPLSNIVCSNPKEAAFDIDPSHLATSILSETHAKQVFLERWYPEAAVDPFWNPALSLSTTIPTPEIEFLARWQAIPSGLPRVLAHALPNGQGDYRVTSPLAALSRAGMASECVWRQRIKGEPRFNSIAEILRLNPDSVIVQNYTITPALAALQEWDASGRRPFTVYALDDLITDMDVTNPFRKDIAANARARLQYALQRCDRLVVSTDYLADAYRGYISDIRVVPNRLEQAAWITLRSRRRAGNKPRIGWAGGSTHQGDLLLLKEIIAQTRDEADWIFFGMCPQEIRPLLAEYHEQVHFSEYPAYLASLNLDIAVAPLAETPFNRGKSNLRLLDYGVLGIPVICTDIEPYRNSPACRVRNTSVAWVEAVRARIYDAGAREREGDAMRRWVLDAYLLENHLDEWLEAHLPG